MKLTEKSVPVETTEMVCEITRPEFSKIGAKVAAKTVMDTIGDDASVDALLAGIAMTSLLAQYTANLEKELFTKPDTNENPDKKEEK